jgi:hypothetical protein
MALSSFEHALALPGLWRARTTRSRSAVPEVRLLHVRHGGGDVRVGTKIARRRKMTMDSTGEKVRQNAAP